MFGKWCRQVKRPPPPIAAAYTAIGLGRRSENGSVWVFARAGLILGWIDQVSKLMQDTLSFAASRFGKRDQKGRKEGLTTVVDTKNDSGQP
jgi:hypothetical protein